MPAMYTPFLQYRLPKGLQCSQRRLRFVAALTCDCRRELGTVPAPTPRLAEVVGGLCGKL